MREKNFLRNHQLRVHLASIHRPATFKIIYDDTQKTVTTSLPALNIVFYSEIRLQVL